jgi:hypothetical protein
MQFDDYLAHQIFCRIVRLGCGRTYKALMFTCKQYSQVGAAEPLYTDAKAALSNHLWTLIRMFPDAAWDWDRVAENPNTTWSMIQTDANRLKMYSALSRNPNITPDIVRNNPDIRWNFYYYTGNRNFDLDDGEFADYVLRQYNFDLRANSGCYRNPNVTIEQLRKYKTAGWDYGVTMQYSTKLTWADICSDPAFTEYPMHVASYAPITQEIVESGEFMEWSMDILMNRHLPLDYIEQYLHLLTAGYYASYNPNITPAIVFAHPECGWDYTYLASNKHFAWGVVESHEAMRSSNMKYRNPNLTWEILAPLVPGLEYGSLAWLSQNEFQHG